MSETETLFAALRQSSDEAVVDMIERMVRDAPDHALNKINALDLARTEGIDEERVIAGLLNAVRLGLFEMTWNVMCPSCSGVLSANKSLKTLDHAQYHCAFCAAGYETTLDNLVEVTFTVSPRVRKIAAHNPDDLSAAEYYRQIFWSSAIDLPDDLEKLLDDVTLEIVDLPAGERAILSLQVPPGTLIVFDPVTHAAQFLEVSGEETSERQNLSVIFNKIQIPVDTVTLRPGPLRVALDNRTDARVLPAVWVTNPALDDLLKRRKSVLTATRLLTNQTFRDIYRTDTLAIGQRLKILSLTFLFSDLKDSTELYERVGDLTAFDLVNEHFRLLQEIIVSERGAVEDHRRRGDGDVRDAGARDCRCDPHARSDERSWCRASASKPAPEDGHPRRLVSRGHSQRPAGLFWPDGQYRLARPGPCRLTFDRGDGIGGGERGCPRAA